jgi:SM-20-related protein
MPKVGPMTQEKNADAFLDFESFYGMQVNSDPFPHLTITNFVTTPFLQRVVAGLPDLKSGGSYPIGALKLGDEAKLLMRSMQGPALRQAISEKFGLDLKNAPNMVTLRGRSRAKDGQIHCDSTTKLVTILLYLNPEADSWARNEGCLRLLRGPNDIENYAEEVPPVNGTMLVFPNANNAWHGHKPFVGQRYVVQLNYMVDSAKARHEMRRHRFSALVKRFLPA